MSIAFLRARHARSAYPSLAQRIIKGGDAETNKHAALPRPSPQARACLFFVPYFIFDNFDWPLFVAAFCSQKRYRPVSRWVARAPTAAPVAMMARDSVRESLRYLFSLCKAVNVRPLVQVCVYPTRTYA